MSKTRDHLVRAVVAGCAGLALAAAASCGGDDTHPTSASSSGGGSSSSSTGSGGGGAPPAETGICSADAWCWSLPAPVGAELDGAWRDPQGAVWVVGAHGNVLRHDDGGWVAAASGTTVDLHAVSGAAVDAIWAVGEDATILHYDGKAWQPEKLPASDAGMPPALYAVAAAAKDDVWVGGAAGFIAHRAASKWSLMTSPSAFAIRAIVVGTTLVYAADDAGVVYTWDGSQWSALGSNGAAAGLAFSPPSDLWYLTTNGNLFHNDGVNWFQYILPPGVYHALVVDGKTIWSVGDKVAKFDSSAMAPVAELVASPVDVTLRAATGGAGKLWFAGDIGVNLAWLDADKSWTRYGAGDASNRLALAGDASGQLWSVGDQALQGDGQSWKVVDTGVDRALYGVAFDSKGSAWAVGTGGTILEFTNQMWKPSDSGTFAWLHAVWFGKTSGWVVGDGGLALTRFQSAWQPVDTGAHVVLRSIHGASDDQVWAVGDSGTILHWDGASWIPQPNGLPGGGPTASLHGVFARAKNDVWVVGESGVILHFNGSKWSPTTVPGLTAGLDAVWAGAADDVYAVGTSGTVLHYDGKKWKTEDAGTGSAFHAVWGNAAGDVWISGEEGSILHKRVR